MGAAASGIFSFAAGKMLFWDFESLLHKTPLGGSLLIDLQAEKPPGSFGWVESRLNFFPGFKQNRLPLSLG